MENYKSKFEEAGLPSKISSSQLKLQGEALLKLITQFNDNLDRFKNEIFFNTPEDKNFKATDFRLFEKWISNHQSSANGMENSLRDLVKKLK